MMRREMLAALAAGKLCAATDMARLFADAQGVGVAIDFASKRLLGAHRLDTARALAVPPGSVLKPLTLMTLIDAGKLRGDAALPCSGDLKIGGASFACSHPRMARPMDLAAAIAYSCNEFVARMAERFAAGELAEGLARLGIASSTGFAPGKAEAVGQVERAGALESKQLQAFGEAGVTSTVFGMAMAYHRLGSRVGDRRMVPIIEGLEGAVEFGTAQRAAVAGVRVAGKTGSARGQWAWFAGFAPSRLPRVVVAVLVRGRAGGADAAPIGGRMLEAYL